MTEDNESEWYTQAACYGVDQLIFFGYPEGNHPKKLVQKAKGFCRVCPVADKCLFMAVTADEKFGVWGGLTYKERTLMPKYFGKTFNINVATEIVSLYGNTAVQTQSN
jgi:WhiB family redox-sensing transcriptional regulator